jgi:hypothetical protein
VHHQEDAGDDLEHQHQQGQRAEEIPEVEVLGRVVLGEVALMDDVSGKRASIQSITA